MEVGSVSVGVWNMRIAASSLSSVFLCRLGPLLFLTLIKFIFLLYWLQYYFTFLPESECDLCVCMCIIAIMPPTLTLDLFVFPFLFYRHVGISFSAFFLPLVCHNHNSANDLQSLGFFFSFGWRICIKMCFCFANFFGHKLQNKFSFKCNLNIYFFLSSLFLCVFVCELVWHFLFLVVYQLPRSHECTYLCQSWSKSFPLAREAPGAKDSQLVQLDSFPKPPLTLLGG